MKRFAYLLLTIALLCEGCSHKGSGVRLKSDTDTVAYIIGLNIGANLQRMDSTLRTEAVLRGIADYLSNKTLLTPQEAQAYYLRYVNCVVPEKLHNQESQFLDDITADSKFRKSESGLRYDIITEGNAKQSIENDTDHVVLRLKITRRDGSEIYSTTDSLRIRVDSLPLGVREGIKQIGCGGTVRLWIPANLAYGATGNDSLKVKANETLYCEAELQNISLSK
jgi:FKBP-type peptidyl-prolyl cis-trans isomerase